MNSSGYPIVNTHDGNTFIHGDLTVDGTLNLSTVDQETEYIDSGVYIPTFTKVLNIVNIISGAQPTYYKKVGNVVNVFFRIEMESAAYNVINYDQKFNITVPTVALFGKAMITQDAVISGGNNKFMANRCQRLADGLFQVTLISIDTGLSTPAVFGTSFVLTYKLVGEDVPASIILIGGGGGGSGPVQNPMVQSLNGGGFNINNIGDIQASTVNGSSVLTNPLTSTFDMANNAIINGADISSTLIRTDEIKSSTNTKVLMGDNLDFQSLKSIQGVLSLATTKIEHPSGIGVLNDINVENGLFMNNNNLADVNIVSLDSLQHRAAGSINVNSHLDFNNVKSIFNLDNCNTSVLSHPAGPNALITVNNSMFFDNKVLYNLNRIHTSYLEHQLATVQAIKVNSPLDFQSTVDIQNVNNLQLTSLSATSGNLNIAATVSLEQAGFLNKFSLRDTSTTDPSLAVGYIWGESSNNNPTFALGALGDANHVNFHSYGSLDIKLKAGSGSNSEYLFKQSGELLMPPSGEIKVRKINTIKYIRSEEDILTVTHTIPAGSYVVCGNVTLLKSYVITGDCSFTGYGRDVSSLNFVIPAGTTNAFGFTITDFNVSFNNLKLTNQSDTHGLIVASNPTKDKLLTFSNCFITNCKNSQVCNITGFDLVDINQTNFMYNYPSSVHLTLIDCSKVQISSCEFLRQLNKALPTQLGGASMIDLYGTMGAINISGCLIHPQGAVQIGILIDNGQTALENVISANTFISVGLNNVSQLMSYNIANHPELIISDNSGIRNQKAILEGSSLLNTVFTTTGSGVFVPVDFGPGFAVPIITRFAPHPTIPFGFVYTAKNPISALINANISADQSTGGNDDIRFGVWQNGIVVATVEASLNSGVAKSFSFTTILQLDQNDLLQFVVYNITAGANAQGFRALGANATLIEV